MITDEEIKKLVIARLETIPPDKSIFIDSLGIFTRDEIIESVQIGNKVGKKMIQVEMEFLRALKKGILA